MKTLTYSKNIFLPVTDLCRNRCGYCSFRKELKDAHLITRTEAMHLLEEGALHGCSEALFTMGEAPWTISGFESLLTKANVADLLDYLIELCEMALEFGLLPHSNAGLLEPEDLRRLQPYNASMGLMLETTAILGAHAKSPGKRPDLRLQYIARAGRLRIPFTTGILVGIGESMQDREEAISKIAHLHRAFGHIQEVIIQPLDPKPGTALENAPRPETIDLCKTVKMAREILPLEVAIQVPPNLVDPLPLITAGADDLGGISTVTVDGINPDCPWPDEVELHRRLSDYSLRERLPVYPRFIAMGWHGQRTRSQVDFLAGEDGLRAKKYIS
ncbi:MAG: 7,8-didemethyl-8-hydroxy-5-deazariboflavin synthase subunit CofG [Methanothrix sp.]|nr:7,8-didemethyl-8-hydroxy-5-deazariboflavin synthase subunit CofG [Methanothrix sp.]MDD4449034.1 7,8-didemethyl-8-hydroxy-5-deazariboflavin synthase subunit CofG [Methanothrix sp.]